MEKKPTEEEKNGMGSKVDTGGRFQNKK